MYKFVPKCNNNVILQSDELAYLEKRFHDYIVNLSDSDKVVCVFNEYVKHACNSVFERKIVKFRSINKSAPWFDIDCKNKRRETLNAGRNISHSQSSIEIVKKLCTEYRSIKQRKKRE